MKLGKESRKRNGTTRRKFNKEEKGFEYLSRKCPPPSSEYVPLAIYKVSPRKVSPTRLRPAVKPVNGLG